MATMMERMRRAGIKPSKNVEDRRGDPPLSKTFRHGGAPGGDMTFRGPGFGQPTLPYRDPEGEVITKRRQANKNNRTYLRNVRASRGQRGPQ